MSTMGKQANDQTYFQTNHQRKPFGFQNREGSSPTGQTMRRQRREEWQDEPENHTRNLEPQSRWQSPPPNRVAASPLAYNNDLYSISDGESQISYKSDDSQEYEGTPSKHRRNSFADPEAFIDAIVDESSDTTSQHHSFVMESPPTKGAPKDPSGSLYYRSHSHHYQSNGHSTPHFGTNDYDDESPQHRLMRQRAFLSPTYKKHHAIHQLHDNNNFDRRTHKSFLSPILKQCRRTVVISKWTFGLAIVFYLFMLSQTVSEMRGIMLEPTVIDLPELWDCWSSSGSTRGTNCHSVLPQWYKAQKEQANDVLLKKETRRMQRKERTRGVSRSQLPLHHDNVWHEIAPHAPTNESPENARPQRQTFDQKTTISKLCGVTAQNASLASPDFYPQRAALNKNSRVVITGILNPIGFSLALKLMQDCGVQEIYGADAMYPNTVVNRLLVQERIQLLQSNMNGSGTARPVILPYIGLDPKAKVSSKQKHEGAKKLALAHEMQWMKNFRPTHVVHLASYSMDAYSDALVDPEWKNTNSPYINEKDVSPETEETEPFMYPLRSGMVAMEQLLSTMAEFPAEERPQFLYITNSVDSDESPNQLFKTMKQIDEMLISSYNSREGQRLPSIGLRLPNSVYGPWGQVGSITHDILEKAVEEHLGKTKTESVLQIKRMEKLDMLFMDDAIDAIISALQYRAEKSMVLSVPTERTTSVESLSSAVHTLLHTNSTNPAVSEVFSGESEIQSGDTSPIISNGQLTPLKEGLVKTIAWHIDRSTPFGPAFREDASEENEDEGLTDSKGFESGDDFLKRYDLETCAPDDLNCHKSQEFLPCNSECNVHDKCLPSVFDDTRELLYDVSEGCDVVMYTQLLGYNVEDAEVYAEYMDDKDLDDDDLLVCNFAIVPRESDLVSVVTSKVPTKELSKFGIAPNESDRETKEFRERKLDGLNGRLLYKGWILIWIKDGTRELSAPDASLLKLSPSKFFHPSVKFGLFVEENFKVSPNLEDVLFLVNEMYRKKLGDRTLKKEEIIETASGPISKKVKYRIPGEPSRRAAILFAPLRFPDVEHPIVEQYRTGHRSLSIHHASKFMSYEVGRQLGESESPSLRRQREFYEKIPTYINKQYLRSKYEPLYQYSMRHWVRSRWVLHDFTLEESRLLRCDWYQEHVQWGNDLDQFSFAKVMAIRDLKRQISHQEPDNRVKSFLEMHPEIHDLTDSYEWHSLETDVNRLYQDPINWNPQPIVSAPATPQELEEEDDSDDETPLYVRIMSERVMSVSRKIWSKMRKKLAQEKKRRKLE